MLLIYPEIVIWAIYLLEARYAVPDMQGRTKGDYISTRARQCFGVNTSALECIGASRGAWNAEEGILSAGVLEMLDAVLDAAVLDAAVLDAAVLDAGFNAGCWTQY